MTNGLAIVSGFFFLAGLGTMGTAVYFWIQTKRAASWPAATATIDDCQWHEDRSAEGDSYRVTVKYHYVVDGRPYSGERIAFGYFAGGSQKFHAAIHSKLIASREVEVRYHPNKPEYAVIAWGTSDTIRILFALGAVCALMAVGMATTLFLQ